MRYDLRHIALKRSASVLPDSAASTCRKVARLVGPARLPVFLFLLRRGVTLNRLKTTERGAVAVAIPPAYSRNAALPTGSLRAVFGTGENLSIELAAIGHSVSPRTCNRWMSVQSSPSDAMGQIIRKLIAEIGAQKAAAIMAHVEVVCG